jgi:hypothetical protein
VRPALYSARIGESHSLGENVSYDALVLRVVEFTVRAALARCVDECEWEHELLRTKGLGALQIFRDARALWSDRELFAVELAEARREHDSRFEQTNELDCDFCHRLDRDLRGIWRRAGYETPSLLRDMKRLFAELESDATERASGAREGLVIEILKTGQPDPS